MNELARRLRSAASARLVPCMTIGLVALLSMPDSLQPGQRIVTVNQHETGTSSDCTQPPSTPTDCPAYCYPTSCDEIEELPLEVLGSRPYIGGNAYHLGNSLQAAQARCKYDHSDLPKILSSDIGGTRAGCVRQWILDLDNNHDLGEIHLEHYEPCLNWFAEQGGVVGDLNTFPELADCPPITPPRQIGPQEMITWIRDSSGATQANRVLRQNGLIHTLAGSPRILRWNVQEGTGFTDNPKMLVGYGYMGALTAGNERLLITPFFQTLRAHNVNFIRVWSVEQWIGRLQPLGVLPFPGPYIREGQNIELNDDSPEFYDRLRRFAQKAADRGIVVQLTLNDYHGLVCENKDGRFKDSPYRDKNNTKNQDFFVDPGCTCTNLDGSLVEDPDIPSACDPPLGYFTLAKLQDVHERFRRRIGEEVGGIGNLIFEVFNEAQDAGPWGNPAPGSNPPTTYNQNWQKEAAYDMGLSLPLANNVASNKRNVVRDAFNGDNNATALNNKFSDIQGVNWTADQARVWLEPTEAETGGLPPDRILGYATSQYGSVSMSGSLNFASTDDWTKSSVRADLFCESGLLRIGMSAADGDSAWVELDCGTGSEVPITFRVYQHLPPAQPTVTATYTDWQYTNQAWHNIRLMVTRESPTSYSPTMFLDGMRIGMPSFQAMSDFTSAFFWGSCAATGCASYPPNTGRIDNFEATRFCDAKDSTCTF